MKIPAGPHSVDLRDDGDMVVAACERDGAFEPEALTAWAEACAGAERVIDIGAYTGIYAITAALTGSNVLAVEANPVVERRLRENIDRNGVKVAVRGLALSDRAGTRELHHNPAVGLTSGGSLEPAAQRSGRTTVRTARLDDLLTEMGAAEKPIGAIKIDVEGHEAAVIAGARETIHRWRPLMIVELLDDEACRSVIGGLEAVGLGAWQLDGRNWLFRPA